MQLINGVMSGTTVLGYLKSLPNFNLRKIFLTSLFCNGKHLYASFKREEI